MIPSVGLELLAGKRRVALVVDCQGFYSWGMVRILLVLTVLCVAGCTGISFDFGRGTQAKPEAEAGEGPLRPRARPDVLAAKKPAENAVTVEQFDTTTNEQRILAAEVPALGSQELLGVTVASLGDPARPGFWLETPLVAAPAKGRVYSAQTGASAQVNLIPIDGAVTAGSRISLSAMRLLGIPLTGLPELEVFQVN